VEVDLGYTPTQDVPEEAFADSEYGNQWVPFYRQRYGLAKKGEDGLVVISSVLVSKGDQFRVRGSTIARLKDIVEMLHEERSAMYELKQEADGSILIAASQTRSVAVGYRALNPNHMPPLAVTPPPTEVTTPRKEYVLLWYNPLSQRFGTESTRQIRTSRRSTTIDLNSGALHWISLTKKYSHK
jgi:hypothetical protein